MNRDATVVNLLYGAHGWRVCARLRSGTEVYVHEDKVALYV